uniref:Retrovirus-related Pol polyprotein from transposon TNT 1-94 n=1 Tax=Tanacetum cinerariifolium TaxID=118510 RepID=A0A6L2NIH6_TANCI|nr:retrovirus-related Pol polyprotein from transposon TNT 1-94 [Tanacetum cinerariifolium]
MTLETHNWSSSAHQEFHKIVKDEIFPIVNKVDTRVQNFKIQFLKEAAKFIGDFKSLAKEADDSLAKHKALELEIERLLRAVVSQDIMSIVQKTSVVDTSNLQTELERTKERFENCIIRKENEYAKLLNDWYKKYTLNPLSQKLKNENVELEFQFLNYTRENAHLTATYKNLFDSIYVSCTQTKTIIASLQKQLHNSIYENAKLRAQLFNKVSDQKDNKRGTSSNTKFSKQLIVENLPKVDETHALSKPVTSNSDPTPQESKVVKNDKVIAPRMFRINPFKTSREAKHVPNNVRASARTKPISVSQPFVITKKEVNSDSNGFSSTGTDNTKTRRPQLRSNTEMIGKHMSSACNNMKFDSQNVISKVVCAMCKQCLISVNHDVCLRNYVNGKNSRGKKHKTNVSIKEKQKKHQPQIKKPKNVGLIERLATPKPRKPRFLLRWSPTGRLFDQKGKIVDSSESESQSDCSNGYPDLFMVRRLGLFQAHDRKSRASYQFRLVYFVEGLGHNVFSVGQFCDSDLEVAFRRNACFVRNLEGVDLLKEAARTMLIFSRAPLFLWAEVIATAYFTHNHSIIHRRFNKTPYELINDRKPDISFLHVFGALCYPKNDRKDIGKLGAKAFLHGSLKEDVYVCQPEGFIDADHPSHVYKLKKALYGLKQAPRAWYDELSTFLLHNHFFKGTIDPTLFIRCFYDDILVVQVYVDDIIFGSTHPSQSRRDLPRNTTLDRVEVLDADYAGCKDTFKSTSDGAQFLGEKLDSGFELTGFSDADYAGSKDTFKSTSGGAQFLGEKLVSWSSKKQDCTTLSNTEAEFVSLSACCAQVLWMQTQLTDYGFHFNKILIYCNSKSAIAISCNPVQHSRTKHIVVRYHFIKEHVEKGTIELYFVKTDYQLANIFTKALPADRFNYLVRRLGMRSLSPQELDGLVKSQ